MNQLLVALYLDENVNVLVAELLRARGFDVTTTAESGQLGASDPAQLAHAVRRERALLTHNRKDYEELCAQYRTDGRRHCGVIITGQRRPHEVVRKLLPLLDRLTADQF